MGYDKIPRQKLPISKKTKQWKEACVEAYIDLSNSGRSAGSNRKESLQSLYEYYNGVIDEADYKYYNLTVKVVKTSLLRCVIIP